jgi:hypothetical protein
VETARATGAHGLGVVLFTRLPLTLPVLLS